MNWGVIVRNMVSIWAISSSSRTPYELIWSVLTFTKKVPVFGGSSDSSTEFSSQGQRDTHNLSVVRFGKVFAKDSKCSDHEEFGRTKSVFRIFTL